MYIPSPNLNLGIYLLQALFPAGEAKRESPYTVLI